MKRLFLICAFLLFPISTFAQTTLQEIADQIDDIKQKLVELKKQAVKEEFLEKLIWCESQGNSQAINYNDIWINGYPSKGILQFSPRTFLKKGIEYGLLPHELTWKETNILIWNENLQKEIARNMLEEPEGWRHWTNCSRKIGTRRLLMAIL